MAEITPNTICTQKLICPAFLRRDRICVELIDPGLDEPLGCTITVLHSPDPLARPKH
jgi:hypothetical protein